MVLGLSSEPLLTKSGKPKVRFTDKDRYCLLGMKPSDLDSFIKIFAPKRSSYILQRGLGCDWWTVHHWLTPRNVLRHLAGEWWVGTRAWPTTNFACIDIDRHGCSNREFAERYVDVERCLRRLEIDINRCLVVPTPGDGLHVYVFFTKPVVTRLLPMFFRSAGLQTARGKIEVYPSENQGLRLPFGYCPYSQTDPHACIKFLDALKKRKIRRYDPHCFTCRAVDRRELKRMEREGFQRGFPDNGAFSVAEEVRPHIYVPPTRRGVPKAERLRSYFAPQVASGRMAKYLIETGHGECTSARFHSLVVKPVWSRDDALDLESLDIPAPGYRLAATKRLAWHFVRVLSLDPEEVVDRLVEYSYSRGASASRDVMDDLKRGTRHVEKQIINLVDWTQRKSTPFAVVQERKEAEQLISESEIEYVVQNLHQTPDGFILECASFLLHWLFFAKQYGCAVSDGWEAAPPVKEVMRKWPGCSGMRYKIFMDWAKECGILRLVREKVHFADGRRGRARTYSMKLPGRGEGGGVSLGRALEIVGERVRPKVMTEGLLGGDTRYVCGGLIPQLDRIRVPLSKTGEGGGSVVSASEPLCLVDMIAPEYLADPICPVELRALVRSHGQVYQTPLEENYQVFCFSRWMDFGNQWTPQLAKHLQLVNYLRFASSLEGETGLLRVICRDPGVRISS